MQQFSCAVQQGNSRRGIVQCTIHPSQCSIGTLTPATVTLPADDDTGRCYVPTALGRLVALPRYLVAPTIIASLRASYAVLRPSLYRAPGHRYPALPSLWTNDYEYLAANCSH